MSLYDVNRATLVGNVTKQPELKQSSTGTSILKFSIATNRSVKKGEEWDSVSTFHNIVCFGKLAERVKLERGEKIYLEGRIENRSYEQEGVKKYVSEIVAENIITMKKVNKAQKSEMSEDVDPEDIPF